MLWLIYLQPNCDQTTESKVMALIFRLYTIFVSYSCLWVASVLKSIKLKYWYKVIISKVLIGKGFKNHQEKLTFNNLLHLRMSWKAAAYKGRYTCHCHFLKFVIRNSYWIGKSMQWRWFLIGPVNVWQASCVGHLGRKFTVQIIVTEDKEHEYGIHYKYLSKILCIRNRMSGGRCIYGIYDWISKTLNDFMGR